MSPDVATLLGEVLDRLRHTSDRPESARVLVQALQELLPCDAAMLWLESDWPGALQPCAASPSSRQSEDLADVRVESATVAARLAGDQRGYVCLTSAGGGDEHLAALHTAMGATPADEVLVLPFVHHARLEGVATCRVAGRVPAERTAAWVQAAPHVATALAASRLREAGTAMAADRRRLAALVAEALTAADTETTAVRLCELTRSVFSTTRSALFLLEGVDLVPLAAAGPYGDRATGGTLHVPPGIEPAFDEALTTQQVLAINEFRSSSYAATPIPLPFRPQAVLVMPLADGAGTIGILTASELADPHRFGADAAETGRLLGAVATVAVRRMLLLEEQQRAARVKDEFLATVSHELRTPVDVVLGYVRLLTDDTFGPMSVEQRETVGRIEHGMRNLLVLVDDLLDLARIERGAITCDPRHVRLMPLLDEMGDAARALIGTRPIRFSCEIGGDPVAWTDPDRLRQVLLNLIGNAIEFTAHGSVTARARDEGGRVLLEIADTGRGMEPGFVRRATEPFVRGDASGGRGLGLAIVARVLRVLNGRLAIDSRPGVGTTVRIDLPRGDSGRTSLPAAP